MVLKGVGRALVRWYLAVVDSEDDVLVFVALLLLVSPIPFHDQWHGVMHNVSWVLGTYNAQLLIIFTGALAAATYGLFKSTNKMASESHGTLELAREELSLTSQQLTFTRDQLRLTEEQTRITSDQLEQADRQHRVQWSSRLSLGVKSFGITKQERGNLFLSDVEMEQATVLLTQCNIHNVGNGPAYDVKIRVRGDYADNVMQITPVIWPRVDEKLGDRTFMVYTDEVLKKDHFINDALITLMWTNVYDEKQERHYRQYFFGLVEIIASGAAELLASHLPASKSLLR